MQSTTSRYLILAAILSLGALAFSFVARPTPPGAIRLPITDDVLSVEGWSSAPGAIEPSMGPQFAAREYRRGASTATLLIKSDPAAKAVYRAGPEVPFLGGGYSVATAPSEALSSRDGIGALVAETGERSYLLIYSYGERRGPFGNGALAWTLAAGDAILGRPNDYYLMTLLAPYDRASSSQAAELVALAETVFERAAAWYSAGS